MMRTAMTAIGRSIWRHRAAVSAALVALIIGAACDRVPLGAPSGSSITMSAPTRTLPTGGSTPITAFVAESGGTPVQNGTTVRFSTTLGRVEPAEAQTRNGYAETTFFAGDISGVAEIRAASGSAGAGTSTGGTAPTPTTPGTTTPAATTSSGTNVLQITIGGAAATAVTVSASPSTVPSSGGTTTIVASAVDSSGNRLRNVAVSFSTDAGTLSSSSALTDDNGEARVQLTTNRQSVVTARVGGQTATVTVTVASVGTVSLSIDPSSPVAGQPMTLTITPTVAANNPPPRVTVDWGDGTRDELGIVPAARGVTHTYATPGFYTITVTANTNGESFTTQQAVQVIAQPTLGVSVSASDTTPSVGQNVTFTASVSGVASGQVTSYEWRVFLGATLESTTTTTSNQMQRSFSSAGNRTVRVTVRTADDRTADGEIPINVQ